MSKTVGVDFDGVLHKYSKGWNGGTIYDEPVEGSKDAMHWLVSNFVVFIFTSRDNLMQVGEWVWQQYGIPVLVESSNAHRKFWNTRGRILITNRKIPASLYIDDRGFTFVNWADTLVGIRAMKVFGDL